jgi:hypothetical protein
VRRPLVYVDRSHIRPDRLPELRAAIADLVAFVKGEEPQLLAYGFHLDEAASAMTVVAVHPDAASLERHLDIGGPEFAKVGAFIELRLIEVFGEPSERAVAQLREKGRTLGDADVVVWPFEAGFSRLEIPTG